MFLYITLFLLWVILNGKFNLEICLFGLALSAAIAVFARKQLGYGQGGKRRTFRYYLLAVWYGAVLVIEIIKANIAVLKIAFARRLNFQPALVYFNVGLKEDRSRVLLADSITMTPGTITVILEDGRYCVHCLDESLAKGIDRSVFVKLLEKMEEASR